MIYKTLTFEVEKKKVPGLKRGEYVFDFTIRERDIEKPLFEIGILHTEEESAKRMAERFFIKSLFENKIKI